MSDQPQQHLWHISRKQGVYCMNEGCECAMSFRYWHDQLLLKSEGMMPQYMNKNYPCPYKLPEEIPEPPEEYEQRGPFLTCDQCGDTFNVKDHHCPLCYGPNEEKTEDE